MTARGARLPASAGRLAAIAAAVAVGGVVGYQLLTRAAAGGTADALALVLGLGALTVALLRPWTAAKLLPAIIYANAGLVLADGYGAPNVVTGLSLLLLGILVSTPSARVQPPRHAGAHRVRRVHRDPHPLGDPGTGPDGRLGDEPGPPDRARDRPGRPGDRVPRGRPATRASPRGRRRAARRPHRAR